jgi:hypothetical protein
MYGLINKYVFIYRGVQTIVAAFGYGGSGALGNGYTGDSFIPIK